MKVSIVMTGIAIVVVAIIIGLAVWTIPPSCYNSAGICTPVLVPYFVAYPIEFIALIIFGIIVAMTGYTHRKSSSPENQQATSSP